MEAQAGPLATQPTPTPPAPIKWPNNNNNNTNNNNNNNSSRQVTTISIHHQPQIHTTDKEQKYYQPQCNGTSGSGGIISKCSVVVSSEQMSGIDEDSSAADAEVSNFTSDTVNLRSKKKRDDELRESIERPMSWEGELSDTEMTTIKPDPEESSMEGIQSHSNSTCSTIIGHPDDEKPQPLKFTNETDKVMEQLRANNLSSHSDLPLLMDKLLSNGYSGVLKGPGPTPSPDSAVYSCYSPAASPVASRHNILSSSSGISSPFTPSLSRNNSDASQYGGSQHSSCYSHSYSSVSESPTQFSPTHSPIQGRHIHRPGYPSPVLNTRSTAAGVHDYSMQGPSKFSKVWPFRPRKVWQSLEKIWKLKGVDQGPQSPPQQPPLKHSPQVGTSNTKTQQEEYKHESGAGCQDEKLAILTADIVQHSAGLASPGISRQQLINSPCPICGDKISGFHYGIFSCESCKGFFKRTVQNRKNYVCLRGSSCPVTITTRKKCPACRFEKCLTKGMKLEAIREDRTRGGRSTYQCSYTVPVGLVGGNGGSGSGVDQASKCGGIESTAPIQSRPPESSSGSHHSIPTLLQEIMEVEHLWQYNETEAKGSSSGGRVGGAPPPTTTALPSSAPPGTNMPDLTANICNIADHRLYKIVKWCKSLPLFKNISIDDQISLLINAWCELLLFSCCFRSMSSPGEIRVSLGKCISLTEARKLGLGPPIERMLNFTEHLRRLRVDRYEYVAMKVIVLLTSDASELREPEKVRASQETALQALQQYTSHHYPDIPSKFGELLLRIPDLQRTCQVGKEMLTIKSKEGEGQSFNLLMELLRGDH